MKRTPQQLAANSFDLDLFNMIQQADHMMGKMKGSVDKERWKHVRDLLNSARPSVRAFMHPEDLAHTEGSDHDLTTQ